MTVADLGYVASLSASVLVGLDEGRDHVVECTDTLLVPFSFGAWHLPGHTARGTTHGRIGDAHMTFTVSEDEEQDENGAQTRVRTLDVEWPRFGAKANNAYAARVGTGLRAHLTLRERVGDDPRHARRHAHVPPRGRGCRARLGPRPLALRLQLGLGLCFWFCTSHL